MAGETPSAPKEKQQAPPEKDQGTSKEGGRVGRFSKRVATRIKSMLSRKENSEKVLKQLSKEGPNMGVDIDKNGKDASADWKKATKRNARRLFLGRKLSKDARTWAKGHKEEVDAKYKKITGGKDRELSRKERFQKHAEAITATRIAAGGELRKGVMDLQKSKDYKNRVTQALNDKTKSEGRPLTKREEARTKRRLLKGMYNEKQGGSTTNTASEIRPAAARGAEPNRADASDTSRPTKAVEKNPQPDTPRPLPADASAADLQQAVDGSSVTPDMPTRENLPDSGTAKAKTAEETADPPAGTRTAPESSTRPAESTTAETGVETAKPATVENVLATAGVTEAEITKFLNSDAGKAFKKSIEQNPDAAKDVIGIVTEAKKINAALAPSKAALESLGCNVDDMAYSQAIGKFSKQLEEAGTDEGKRGILKEILVALAEVMGIVLKETTLAQLDNAVLVAKATAQGT